MKKFIQTAFLVCFANFAFSQSFVITPTEVNKSQSGGINDDMILTRFGVAPKIITQTATGTASAPTAVTSNFPLLFIGARGYTGTQFSTTSKAAITFSTTELWNVTSNGTSIGLNTTSNGTTTPMTRMFINHNGNLGIGTTSPLARLHIVNGGASGISGTPADELIIENNANNYIQMMNPQENEAGIIFGLPSSIVSGSIIYNNAGQGALHFRTNANQNRMAILSNGNVGIGTIAPTAKLDVEGTAKIGTNGTAITEIIKHSEVKDIVSTNAGTEATLTFVVPNVQLGSTVHVSPSQNLPDGLIIAHALVENAGAVEVKFFNASSAAVNPPSMTFYLTIIR